MEEVKAFIKEYCGAIIGGLIAVVILFTQLYKLMIGIILISIGVFAGNYIQRNKQDVKEKIKNVVDKM